MKAAAVYAGAGQSSNLEKETLIHEQVSVALATLADLERHTIATTGSKAEHAGRSIPGLTQFAGSEAVVALGRAAHLRLADFRKRTLIASDLDLEGDGGEQRSEDIEQLIWSCTNTLAIVGLGERAWQSVQLLPINIRRYYNVPPLDLGAAAGGESDRHILVINHDRDDTKARVLADVLDRCGMDFAFAGLVGAHDGARCDDCWSDDAFIHVHVGGHTLTADEPRLVDSWRSDRITLQLMARRRSGFVPDACALMIEDEANGFICETPDEVVVACHELLEDRVLQRKVIAAGQNSVAPLVKTWFAVAEDLLA